MLDVDNTGEKPPYVTRVSTSVLMVFGATLKFCYCFRVVFRWWNILLRTVIRKLQNFL